jgi:hypothetical protein
LHPEDLRICELTGLPIYFGFATENSNPRLQVLVDLLNGIKRNAEARELWADVASKVAAALGRRHCRVEAAVLSPDKRHLAICSQARTLLGFRVHYAGCIYTVKDRSVVGRVAQGRRTSEGWSEVKS